MSLYISKRNRILKTRDMDCVSIAEVQNSAKVWISHSEYTISESHLDGGILQLRYKTKITMVYYYSRIPICWSNP